MSAYLWSAVYGSVDDSVRLRLIALAAGAVAMVSLAPASEVWWLLPLSAGLMGEGLLISWLFRRSWQPAWSVVVIVPLAAMFVVVAFGALEAVDDDWTLLASTLPLLIAAASFHARSRGNLYALLLLSAVALVAGSRFQDDTPITWFFVAYLLLVLAMLATTATTDAAEGARSQTSWNAPAWLMTMTIHGGLVAGLAAVLFLVLPWQTDEADASSAPASSGPELAQESDSPRSTLPEEQDGRSSATDVGRSQEPASEPAESGRPGQPRLSEAEGAPGSVPPPSTTGEGGQLEAPRPGSEPAASDAPEPSASPVDMGGGTTDTPGDSSAPRPGSEPATSQEGAPPPRPEADASAAPQPGGPDSTVSPQGPTAPVSDGTSDPETDSATDAKSGAGSGRFGDDLRRALQDSVFAGGARTLWTLGVGLFVTAVIVPLAFAVSRRGNGRNPYPGLRRGQTIEKDRRDVLTIYGDLETLLSRQDFPSRSPSETPARYLARVAQRLPESLAADLRLVIGAVTDALYAPSPPNPASVDGARLATRRIEVLLSNG